MEAGLLILCCVTVVIGWLLHSAYKWVCPPCKGRLPPGSMGFPIIGEDPPIHESKPVYRHAKLPPPTAEEVSI